MNLLQQSAGRTAPAVHERAHLRAGGIAMLLVLAAALWLPSTAGAQGTNVIERKSPSITHGEPEFIATSDNGSIYADDAIVVFVAADSQAMVWEFTPLGAPPDPADLPDGTPIPVPTAVPTGCTTSESAAVHPSHRFVYYAFWGAGSGGYICAFQFDAIARTLTPVPGSPFRAGAAGTQSVAIDPSGTFLYTVNQNEGMVYAFAIDANTGALTTIAGSPFVSGPDPQAVVIDASGRFAYVAHRGHPTGTVAGFAIDAGTGALTKLPGAPYTVPTVPVAIAADPKGRYVFTVGEGVQAYAINQATGVLTPIGAPIDTFGWGIAVDPTAGFVYTTSVFDNGINAYRIGANGALSTVGGMIATGSNPMGVAVAPSGRFVYVANEESKNISGFLRDDATGVLTPISGSPFPASDVPVAVTTFAALPARAGWHAGKPMFYPLGVSGGYPPYTWAVVSGALPPGLTVDPALGALRGTPTTAGTYEFVAQVADSHAASATKAYTFVVVGVAQPAIAPVVEFYNKGFDHYFITWVTDEIAELDAGTVIKGWTRTGKSFNTYAAAQPGSSPICRYYIPPAQGDSHFFGRGTVECDATGAKNPAFILEDPSFMYMILPDSGVCPANTTPVYRVFSNRQDANHRYMIDRAVRDDMVANGWLAEGDGADLVVMCAP